ncbi:MAG: GNAT family N-acetyltransferase [Vicinamibacterales bacterium]
MPTDPRGFPPSGAALPATAERVRLRRLREADLPRFQAYRHDPIVGQYQGWQPTPDDEARAFLIEMSSAAPFSAGVWFQLGIADRLSDLLIGDIGVCVSPDGAQAEIGFTLSRESQGQGLAREAIGLVLKMLFSTTNVRQIFAVTDARNTAANTLLFALGLQRTRTTRAIFRNEPCVEYTYSTWRPSGGAGLRETHGATQVTTSFNVKIRRLGLADVEFLKLMLFEAFFWNATAERPAFIESRDNPEFVKLYTGWGRTGDIGFIAEKGVEPLGAAWCRAWTDEVHSDGFVDRHTPELAIAVHPAHRGKGIGRALMMKLVDQARADCLPALSLSVSPMNPACSLYESLGFQKVGESGTSWTLRLALR